MGNVSLQHYRRKKFCYRFFMRESPRSGRICGVGIIACCLVLKPLLIFWIAYLAFSAGRFIWWPWLLLVPPIIVGYCIGGMFFYSRRDRSMKSGGLLTVDFWRRPWHYVFFAAAIAVIWADGGSWPGRSAVLILVTAGCVCQPEQRPRKLRKIAFVPVMLALAVLVGTHLAAAWQRSAVDAEIAQLASTVGPGIYRSGLIGIENSGFPMAREPLRTLRANRPSLEDKEDYSVSDPPEKAAKKLANYRKAHSRFIAALEEFCRLAVHYVGHRPADNITETVLCHKAFYEGAKYYARLIQTAGGDREAIRAANDKLEKLRDWMLNSQFPYENFYGNDIERLRLQALAGTLPTVPWTPAEFRELLGELPPWKRVFVRSRAVALLEFDEIVSPVAEGRFGDGENISPRLVPDAFRLYMCLDWRNMLDIERNAIRAVASERFDGQPESRRLQAMRRPAKGYFYSGMLGDAHATAMWRSCVRAMERRQATEIAYEVMAECRRTGRMPADLSFMKPPPRSISDNGKIELQVGMLTDDDDREFYGFRLHIAGREKRNRMTVRMADAPPKP